MLDKLKQLWYYVKAVSQKTARTLKIKQYKKRTEACEGITLDILLKQWVNTLKTLLSNFETLMRCEMSNDFKLWEEIKIGFNKEFDPGSGRTLAARLTHASRTGMQSACWKHPSGGRVSNTWATCPCVWNNVWKRTLIPHDAGGSHGPPAKDLSHRDGLAAD